MSETTTPVWNQPKDGITADTPKRIMFGAGTIHKGLEYTVGSTGTAGSWNFSESLFCATGDGNTLTITPEITNVEVDGAWVKVEGLQVKTGETAELEVTPVEITTDVIKAGIVGTSGSNPPTNFALIESKERIEAGDYIENLGFVGTLLDGSPVIVIFDKALCTSGFELGGANKEASKPTMTFECVAEISGSHRKLPYHIYYPDVQG